MSISEVHHHINRAVRSKCEQFGFGLANPRQPSGHCGSPLWDPMPVEFSSTPYTDAADRILAGEFSIFSMRNLDLGFPPEWNQDPRTKKKVPLKFGKAIEFRNKRVVGSIKYLWEINRHLELVTLAQAWHLSREPCYAAGCKSLLESWFEQSPYPFGVNWASSLEVAIRVVNWSFAWHLLGGDRSPLFKNPGGVDFRQRWLSSVYQHLHFIAGNKSRCSSANNHLLGELLGLYVGSINWPLWPETRKWCQQAQIEFEREIRLQTAADGVNREQAIWYHHEVIDMMLIAALFGRANKHEFSRMFWERLEAMMVYVASVMDVGGGVPSWGDSDDAVMARLCPDPKLSVFQSVLATGAVLFNRSDFKEKAKKFDDKTRWLLGDVAESKYLALSGNGKSTLPKQSFPEAGYYILGSNFDTADEVRIIADAGPLGYLSIAAHGHADALSFTLSISGERILIDPGTYTYDLENEWREYFRGTSAHNTLRVDSLNQSVSGGGFLWTKHAIATCIDFQSARDYDKMIGKHNGYNRLSDSVLHQREINFDKQTNIIYINDEVCCREMHLIEMFWHFSEDCEVHLFDGFVLVRKKGVETRLIWPADAVTNLVCGQETPPLGWIAPRFDDKYPSPTVVTKKRVTGNWHASTRIHIVKTRNS